MSIDTERDPRRPQGGAMLFDVELYLCTQPACPELVELVQRAFATPAADRAPLAIAARELARDELATSSQRWTPHYDAALRALVDGGDELFVDVDPEAYDAGYRDQHLDAFHAHLEHHRRACDLLDAAVAGGAHTLGDAFDTCGLALREIALWFGLVPDPDALIARVRGVLIEHLRSTAAESQAPITEDVLIAAIEGGFSSERISQFHAAWRDHRQPYERRLVVDALAASTTAGLWRQLGYVPPEVFARLGNPFRPRYTATESRL